MTETFQLVITVRCDLVSNPFRNRKAITDNIIGFASTAISQGQVTAGTDAKLEHYSIGVAVRFETGQEAPEATQAPEPSKEAEPSELAPPEPAPAPPRSQTPIEYFALHDNLQSADLFAFHVGPNFEFLDRHAKYVAYKCKFTPGIRNGIAVATLPDSAEAKWFPVITALEPTKIIVLEQKDGMWVPVRESAERKKPTEAEKPKPAPIQALENHVTGAIERGEKEPIVERAPESKVVAFPAEEVAIKLIHPERVAVIDNVLNRLGVQAVKDLASGKAWGDVIQSEAGGKMGGSFRVTDDSTGAYATTTWEADAKGILQLSNPNASIINPKEILHRLSQYASVNPEPETKAEPQPATAEPPKAPEPPKKTAAEIREEKKRQIEEMRAKLRASAISSAAK